MAFAMQWPEGLQRGRGNCSQIREQLTKTQENLISKSRYVLRNSPMGIAGITPPIIITDIDPKLAVHRSNNQNRDATPGQKAMATAMAFPEAAKGGDRKSSCFKQLDFSGFDKSLLSRARYVLRNRPMVEGDTYPRRWRSIAPITKTETQRQGKRQWRLRWCFRMESGAAIERRIVSNHFKMI